MTDKLCIDEKYSTTRLLTKEKPLLKQKPEYKLEPKLFLPLDLERKGEGGLRTKGYFKKSYDNKPLISVVTVVYNGEKHLEQTINSVLEQGYDNVEYIIIDGGSTDGTLEIIKKYEDQIDYWVSEPDSGIYDAMNKGISLCTGDYIAFLNADDWYTRDGIENIVSSVSEGSVSYVFANVDMYNEKNEFSYTMTLRRKSYRIVMPFGHPALFVKKDILFSIPFDQQYNIASDYDFICKLIKKKLPSIYLDKSIVNFREGGVSSTADKDKELFKIRFKHFGIFVASYSYILNTQQPQIARFVKILVNIKHWIQRAKI